MISGKINANAGAVQLNVQSQAANAATGPSRNFIGSITTEVDGTVEIAVAKIR